MKIKMMRPGGTIPAGNGGAPGTGAKGGSGIHWLTVGISVGLSVLAVYMMRRELINKAELTAKKASKDKANKMGASNIKHLEKIA